MRLGPRPFDSDTRLSFVLIGFTCSLSPYADEVIVMTLEEGRPPPPPLGGG